MAAVLVVLLVWLVALVGLGVGACRLLALSLTQLPGTLRAAVAALVGMAVVSLLGVGLNLVMPLGPGVASVVALTGLSLLLVPRVRRLIRVRGTEALAVAAFAVFGARVGSQAPTHYDVGLYHLQAIRWLTEQAAPLGLANLHSRLAYSGAWFAVPALLELPGCAGQSFRVVGALLAVVLAMVCLHGVRAVLGGRAMAANLLAALTITGLVLGLQTDAVASSSSDWPVTVITLVVAVLCLRVVEGSDAPGASLPLAAVLSVFAVTVKWSGLPVLLLPVAAWVAARRWPQRQDGARKPLRDGERSPRGEQSRTASPRWLAAVVILLVATLGRSVWVSGYPFYPSHIAGLSGLPWAVPRAAVVDEEARIRAWARAPGEPPGEVLASWSWVGAWSRWFVTSGDVLPIEGSFVLGVALLAWSWVRRRSRRAVAIACLSVALPAAAGVLLWFLTAPDLRFGLGFLLLLGLTPLATGLVAAGVNRASRVAVALAVGVMLGFLLRGKVWPLMRPPDSPWGFPPIPKAVVSERITTAGEVVLVPTVDDRCWRAALPCTPHFHADLRIVRGSSGRIRSVSRGAAARPVGPSDVEERRYSQAGGDLGAP